jgi:hypothetical protein
MPADGKGAKGGDVMTRTHATGSALSYGMRYLLKMIFNVAVGEDDDDGNDADEPRKPKGPDGFDQWLTDLELVADRGMAELEKAWKGSRQDYRTFVTQAQLGALKAKAKRVQS